ncbi:MAG: hypothetical protein GXO90_10050, partial [FCB group bacterium]|nr:hypothetical protein [FCB group bacterium]
MVRKKSIIILGAGASQEVGLPVGSELKNSISELLDIRFDEDGIKQISGDYSITAALRIAVNERENHED